MAEDRPTPVDTAPQLQEAIDVIVQTFDYPAALSIEYTFDAGTKRTTFVIQTAEENTIYELQYDGHHDEAEPRITQRN